MRLSLANQKGGRDDRHLLYLQYLVPLLHRSTNIPNNSLIFGVKVKTACKLIRLFPEVEGDLG